MLTLGTLIAPASAAKSRHTITADLQVRESGGYRLVVRTSARRVLVKLSRGGATKLKNRRVKNHKSRLRVPADISTLRVRALRTKNARASKWTRVAVPTSPTPSSPSNPGTPGGTTPTTPTPQDGGDESLKSQLERVAALRIFFGHQSVGADVLGGVPAVYAANAVTSPRRLTAPVSADVTGPYLSDSYIGENYDPDGKLRDFDETLRGGMGDRIDVAFLKFCYVDITADRDVEALFLNYRRTLSSLQAQYPNVTFLHLTAPLTVGQVPDSLAREKFNTLMRAEYGGTGRLFDIAAVESTTSAGRRVSGVEGGKTYYLLDPAYAADNAGHLNSAGSKHVAQKLLQTIANARS